MAKVETFDQEKLIQNVVSNMVKTYGEGSALVLSKSDKASGIKCVSTGVTTIDRATYGKDGGIPIGMLTEISGWESTGKTLLAKNIIAQTQKMGGIGVYIDSECAYNMAVAKAVGVDNDKLIYCQPDSLEQVFEMINMVIEDVRDKYDGVVTIVWDSIASTPMKSELEGKVTMGERARLIGSNLRVLTRKVSKMKICLIFINQLREKIGVLFGSPDTAPGGNAVPFHSAVRIRMKKGVVIYDGNNAIGEWFSLAVIKNKIAPPFKTAKFEVYFDKGIPPLSGYADYLVEKGALIDTKGWYSIASLGDQSPKFRYGDFEKIAKEHPELLEF